MVIIIVMAMMMEIRLDCRGRARRNNCLRVPLSPLHIAAIVIFVIITIVIGVIILIAIITKKDF